MTPSASQCAPHALDADPRRCHKRTTSPVSEDSVAAQIRATAARDSSGVIRFGEVTQLGPENAEALSTYCRPVEGVGESNPVGVVNRQPGLSAVDIQRSFRTDDLHASVDSVRRGVRQVPDRLDDAHHVALQSDHRPPSVRILALTRMDLLGVNAQRLGLAEPEHQIQVVNPITHERRDLVEVLAANGPGKIPPRIHRDDPAEATLVDRLFRDRHARIEPTDMTDHEEAFALPGGLENIVARTDRRRHRLLEEDVLA